MRWINNLTDEYLILDKINNKINNQNLILFIRIIFIRLITLIKGWNRSLYKNRFLNIIFYFFFKIINFKLNLKSEIFKF